MPFPFENLNVGDLTPVKCRTVRHRGVLESDFVFGEWKYYYVKHVQRDRYRRIAAIAFVGVDQEYDPRHDYNSGGGPMRQKPSLLSGDLEFQFER